MNPVEDAFPSVVCPEIVSDVADAVVSVLCPDTVRDPADTRPVTVAEDAKSAVAVVVASVEVPVTERVDAKFPVVPVIAPKLATVE